MGGDEAIDLMVYDGLWDIFNNCHMGVTAENIAERYVVTRQEQDEFAVKSQNKAEAAIKAGKFKDEIVPVGDFSTDEFPRFGTTKEILAMLKPAFKEGGTVTAGNSSGINDGAGAVLLMSEKKAKENGIKPMATIVSYGFYGVPPDVMGIGPAFSTGIALERARIAVDALDLIELNEAFAAQSVAVIRKLGLNADRVNVNGGAIALGHPIGASGTRILVTLLHELGRRKVTYGLAALCVGGGQGISMVVKR